MKLYEGEERDKGTLVMEFRLVPWIVAKKGTEKEGKFRSASPGWMRIHVFRPAVVVGLVPGPVK